MPDIRVALLTISDSRTLADDKSGDLLAGFIAADNHHLADRKLVPDDIYAIRAQVSQWIADPQVQAVITIRWHWLYRTGQHSRGACAAIRQTH